MSATDGRTYFEQAMQHLQAGRAADAVELCRTALAHLPDEFNLLTLHGAALLACREPQRALEPLQRAVARAPRFPRARENLGQALLMLGRLDEAIEELQLAAALDPDAESVHFKLGHALARKGQGAEADELFEQAFARAPDRRRLAEAAQHLRAGRAEDCQRICQDVLQQKPDDVNALRMLARVAFEAERWTRAERLLLRVLEITPGFHDARLDLARVLKQQDRLDDAVACTAEAVERSPRYPAALYLHASMLAVDGRYDEALAAYRRTLEVREQHPAAWVGMGHLLKTLGRTPEAITAYRTAIAQRPNFGEVYWSLANLKTFRFTPDEVAEMERRLDEKGLDEDARVHFLFTLAKSREDEGEYARAFALYAEACALQRMRVAYDPVETAWINERIREVFTRNFVAARAGQGCQDPAPIFIVGLPRSGSTLIEQILASHSQVEGTAELPDIGRLIGSLSRRFAGKVYPEAVRDLQTADLYELGAEYLERTRRHRSGRPFFTDKMPNNFPSIGFIHLILPNAKIIDARRHPLDSCFGSFKQHFAYGQAWSYDLMDIGEYFLEYRQMMRHWAEVLPGKVLEVRYEDLVRDQERVTRRLLAFCGLPWEDACLRFWQTERPVRTASSEQVRQPLYADSVNRWRNFRTELEPLNEILADELQGWDA